MLQSHRGVSFNAARSNPGGQPFSGTSMLELEFAQLSDPGKVRGHNEDFIGYAEPSTPEQARNHGWLFVLADGCGGTRNGGVGAAGGGVADGSGVVRAPRRATSGRVAA